MIRIGKCAICSQEIYYYEDEDILFHEDGTEVDDYCPTCPALTTFKRTMHLPDVLPSGQTGWTLSLRERNEVRAAYRELRNAGCSRGDCEKFAVQFVIFHYREAVL